MTVCSGIGAPEMAAPWIDWRFQSEIEPFPCAVLAKRFPDAVNLGDMTKFEDWPDANIDVLCGGTPCQSFSVAGLRKGLADPRGNRALTYLAIAARYRPRWLVWENVPGVLSSNDGRDFGTFLGALGQLGYGFAYRVLDAQYTRTRSFPHAVPQRRRRVFVVGYLGDWTRAAAVLFDSQSLRGDPAPRREAGQAAPTIPNRSTASGGLGTDFDCDRGLIPSHDPACTLTARDHKGPLPEADLSTVIAIQERAVSENPNAGPGGAGIRTDGAAYTLEARQRPQTVAFDTTQITSPANYSNPRPGDPCHPLAAGAHAPAVAFDMRGREGGAQMEGPHDTANLRAASGGSSRSYVALPWAVRRLTPTECERLMGFPDGHTLIEWRGKPLDKCPDGPRYKALGNSWAVNCGEWLFDNIKRVEAMA